MTTMQKIWARFKTHFITAYHKLKKQRNSQVNNNMNGENPALTSKKLQKVATQFDEGQQQLANFSEANNTLKELVDECNNNITARFG